VRHGTQVVTTLCPKSFFCSAEIRVQKHHLGKVNKLSAIWKAAGDFLILIINGLYSLTHSYGLAIIILTLLVRVLLYPLSHKQMVSMQKMQKLQPRLKVLQEKYKDDKETLNKEIMRLYKENNVNPAAGCLPLLVQLPILILLFRVLMNLDLGGATFLGISLEGSVLSTMKLFSIGHLPSLSLLFYSFLLPGLSLYNTGFSCISTSVLCFAYHC